MNKRLFFTFDKKVENNRLRGLKINFQAKKPNFQTFKSLKVEKITILGLLYVDHSRLMDIVKKGDGLSLGSVTGSTRRLVKRKTLTSAYGSYLTQGAKRLG